MAYLPPSGARSRVAAGHLECRFQPTAWIPCRTFHATLARAQTAADANAQMNLLTRAQVSSRRVGDAMEIDMYIGLGTLVLIIVLFLILR